MTSFVISKLVIQDRKLSRVDKLYSILMEKILLFPSSYYRIDNISITKINDKDVLEIILEEPVEITFTKHNVTFSSEIIIYIYIIYYNNKVILISSPQGFGLIRKGGHLRRYIDLTVWQNLLYNVLKSYRVEYKPLMFSNEQLSFEKWGEELVEICINIPKVGKITINYGKKKDIYNYKEFYNFYQTILSHGIISKIKVRSSMIKKIVEVRDTGIVKVNEKKDILKIINYLINILGDIT